jgi:DNA-binding MarR family transcriptional regulator
MAYHPTMDQRDLAPPPGLTELTTHLASKVGLIGRRLVADAVGAVGVRAQHYGVLACLTAYGPTAQCVIAGHLSLDASDVVAIVDDMESAGLVERRRDLDDRRRWAVTLTESGIAAYEQARAAALAAQDEFLCALDPSERADFSATLLEVLASHDIRYENAEGQAARAASTVRSGD